MKKISLILTFVMLCFMQAKAIDIEGMFVKYKHSHKADNVSVSYPLMKLTRLVMPKNVEGADIIKAINSVHVLDMELCSEAIKSQFTKDASLLSLNRYEVLVDVNDEDEHTRILAKRKDKLIKELIILQTGKEALLVRITGKIDPQKYMHYANKYAQKKKE